jgi:glycosyltransferase involved in cell wall biosynthesis
MCMKIGIDARFYGPKVGGGGIGRYVADLVTQLQELDRKNQYVLFLKKENFHECVIRHSNFYKQVVDVPWYTLSEQRKMPRAVRQARVDFMHYPHWNVPVFSLTPFLVTIHDLILIEDPKSAHATTRGSLIHGFKYAGFRTVIENAIHRSRHIIAVSDATKKSILKHFGVREKKISVIHNGVNPPVSTQNVSLSQLGVYEPYFLYVGNAYPHKNLEMMMHAFSQFAPTHHHVQLVIAGRRDVFSRRLEKEANEIEIPADQVRFIDFPTDNELAALYKNAALFIYPSRLEGFGLPPLEAMSYDVPVAAARIPVLQEVLGEAANYFDVDDIEALYKIMLTAADNQTELQNKIALEKHQAASFTWQSAAEEVIELYNQFPRLKYR